MAVVLVTGSAGLIGGETIRHFVTAGYTVAGADNNMGAHSRCHPSSGQREERRHGFQAQR